MAKKDVCINSIQKVFKELSPDEVAAIVNQVDKLKDLAEEAGDFRSARQEVFRAINLEQKKHLNAIEGRLIQVERESAASRMVAELSAEIGVKEAFNALLLGSGRVQRGAALNLGARIDQASDELHGILYHGFQGRKDLIEIWRSGKEDDAIIKNVWNLSEGNANKVEGTSKEAFEIAKAVNAYNNRRRQMQIESGLDIGFVSGYVMKQAHDVAKIRALDPEFDKAMNMWVESIMPLLDHKKTFKNVDIEPEDFLRDMFRKIASGEQGKVQDDLNFDGVVAVNNYANIGRRLEKSRQLHFKDADAFIKYNKTFGRGNLAESISHGMRQDARSIAMVQMFGPNPIKGMENVIKQVRKIVPDDQKENFGAAAQGFRDRFEFLRGTREIPQNISLQRFEHALRVHQDLVNLGGASISSMTDWINSAMNLKAATGRPFLQNLYDITFDYFAGIKSTEVRQRMLIDMGFMFDDMNMLNAVGDRLSISDHLPGKMSQARRWFFRANFLTQHTESGLAASGRLLMTSLDELKDLSYSKLPDRVKHNFKVANIGEAEWDVMRRGSEQYADGRRGLTFDGIRKLEGVDEDLKARVLANYGLYMRHVTHKMIPLPGAKEKWIIRGNSQAGTAESMIRGFMGQFKSFPLTMHSVMNFIASSNPNVEFKGMSSVFRHPGDMPLLAQWMMGMTSMAVVTMLLKDLASNRTPRDPTDPKTLAEAFIRGGTAGLYGDFLLGEHNRHIGRTASRTLFGPVGANVDDTLQLFSQAIRGDAKAKDAVRLLIKNTPGQNLFYTKMGFDHLMMDQLMESLNPGYKNRRQRSLRERTGQEPLFR